MQSLTAVKLYTNGLSLALIVSFAALGIDFKIKGDNEYKNVL